MPRGELRLQLLEQRERAVSVAPSSVDLEHGCGVDRRLDDPRGLRSFRRVCAALGLPEVGAGEVPRSLAEHDVGKQPVAPLTGEQRAELVLGALLVPRRLTHGDASGVPAPLMWIQLP